MKVSRDGAKSTPPSQLVGCRLTARRVGGGGRPPNLCQEISRSLTLSSLSAMMLILSTVNHLGLSDPIPSVSSAPAGNDASAVAAASALKIGFSRRRNLLRMST